MLGLFIEPLIHLLFALGLTGEGNEVLQEEGSGSQVGATNVYIVPHFPLLAVVIFLCTVSWYASW